MGPSRHCLIALVLLVLAQGVAGSDVMNVLLIGQVTEEHCPAPSWFEHEPLVDFSLVPTKYYQVMSYEEAQRFIRVYFPRGADEVADYDFFMFINPYFEPFIPRQIDELRTAIVEGGSGAFQTLGGITIDWTNVNWPWIQSSLAEIFPNDPLAHEAWEGQKESGNLPYFVIVNQDPALPPVLKLFVPVGIQEVRGYWTIVLIVPQQGATVWARAVGAYPKAADSPPAWLLSWRYGKGMTWSVGDDLDCPWWSNTYKPSDQQYGLDILDNIMLHSMGRPLPDNIALVNAVRRAFSQYHERASTLVSFLDFVERFGVSTAKLAEERLAADAVRDRAMQQYLDGLFQDALDTSEEAAEDLGQIEMKAMRMKDRALMWVYLIEWCAVTGTGMVTGYILYALMLKRRLYREVSVTRALR